MTEVVATNETILVVGGGISGMTAALEAAETGKRVVLVEKRPYVGGRVSQLYKYFPKLCFPTCGLEMNQRRGRMNPNLTILTMAKVTGLKGEKGNYTATVKLSPRYVNDNCTACGDCTKAVEAQFDDEYNYGLSKRSGAYLPYRCRIAVHVARQRPELLNPIQQVAYDVFLVWHQYDERSAAVGVANFKGDWNLCLVRGDGDDAVCGSRRRKRPPGRA